MRSVCGCPCGLVHPQVSDVCQITEPVTTRTSFNRTYQEIIPVLMCQGCADLLDALRAEFGKPPIRKETKQ